MNYNDAVSAISSVIEPKNGWTVMRSRTCDVWVKNGGGSGPSIYTDYENPADFIAAASQPWVATFSPTEAPYAARIYHVMADGALVENVTLVLVDGGPDGIGQGRALLPLPGANGRVPLYRYKLACIVNDSQANLDFAMKKAGFTVGTDNTP